MEIAAALLIASVSSVLTILLPYSNGIVNIVLCNILCSMFGIENITKELSLLSSFVIFNLIKSVREIQEPETSGSEDFAVFGNSSQWKCLQVQPFEQIKTLVESRIAGMVIGLAISYFLIDKFKFDMGSLPITKLILIYIVYKTFKDLEYKAFITKQKLNSLIIKALLYASIAPICFYVLSIWGCYSPAVIVIYLIFIVPNIIDPLFTK